MSEADCHSGFDFSQIDFLTILSELDEGVIITDADGRIRFYNRAQAAIDGLEPEQVIGRHISEIYRLNENNSMLLRCIRNRAAIVNQLFYYRIRKGKLLHAIHSVYPLETEAAVKGAICFIRNGDVVEKIINESAALINECNINPENGTSFNFSDIIGGNPDLINCLNRAKNAARTRSPIMIFGETGTGKEIVAQAIHNYGPRRLKPFVAVNCAAIPDTLQESILFGTAKGAFTGAMDKKGLFEEAKGGTLYLDEIDSMPKTLQAKLLRTLQEKKIRKLGSPGEIPIDVRIISSVNKLYKSPIPEDLFRMDLFYRLSVVTLEIPPLRIRKADIDALTRHFINKNNYEMDAQVESVTPEVLEFFLTADWPGNVRELAHVIEGAINVMGEERLIGPEHLPDYFERERNRTASAETEAFRPHPEKSGLEAVEDVQKDMEISRSLSLLQAQREKEIIREAIANAGGNISRAARGLNISRQLLHYKRVLKQYQYFY